MSTKSGETNLSAKASRGTVGGISAFLGWLALGVLAAVTAGHAISITMAWANLNPAGGDVIAILALTGVALVEVFAVLTAVDYATHNIRAKQKPVAMAIEGLWFVFAAVNLISSFAMKHGGAMPAFVGYWITFGLPIAGLTVGGLFYVVKRLDPAAGRAEDDAELKETFASVEHDAKVEVLDSEQMRVVMRQMMWQTLPAKIGRELGLSEAQIRNLELHAPALLEAKTGVSDQGRGAGHDLDAADLEKQQALEKVLAALDFYERHGANGANPTTGGRP